VLAPSRRSWALRSQFAQEQRWAEVVLLVGGAAQIVGSGRLAVGGPPRLVDDGSGPVAVPAVPMVTNSDRAAARRALGLADELTVWLPAGRVEDRERTRSELVATDPGGSVVVAPLLDEARDRSASARWRAAADVAVVTPPGNDEPLHRPPRDLLLAAWSGLPLVAPADARAAGLVDESTGALADAGSLRPAIDRALGDRARRGAAAAERAAVFADPETWLGVWTRRCTAALR
jgi:hypothetical protein